MLNPHAPRSLFAGNIRVGPEPALACFCVLERFAPVLTCFCVLERFANEFTLEAHTACMSPQDAESPAESGLRMSLPWGAGFQRASARKVRAPRLDAIENRSKCN